MHENKKYRRTLYILSNIALVLCFLMFIPFGRSLEKGEAVIKFFVIPAGVLIINAILSLKKFEDYRPSSRFLSYVSYLPMFAYIASLCVNLILISNRAEPTAVFSFETYIVLITVLTIVGLLAVAVLFNLEKINIKLSKNQVNIIDVLIYVACLCVILLAKTVVADKYVGVEMFNSSMLNIAIGVILGAILVGALYLRSKKLYETNAEFVHRDKQKLIDEWRKLHDDAYYNGELVVLIALNNYAKERLIFEEYEKVSLPEGAVAVNKDELNSLENEIKELKGYAQAHSKQHEALKEKYIALQNKVKVDVASTELEGLNKQLTLLDESIKEEDASVLADINQYQEEKAQFEEKKAQLATEKAALLAELKVESFDDLKPKEEQPTPKAEPKPKVEKVLVPSYDEVLDVAKAVQGEAIECNANTNGTMHKFTSNGKVFLIMQKTASDYRVTFSVLEEEIMENLRKFPGVIEVAKTPKTGNFLRLVNKSEFDAEILKGFVNASLDCVKDAERRVQEAKEAEKQAKLEAKEQEKRNKELLKEAEKIVAKAKKEEEKALKAAEKAAEKENKATSEEEAA